MANADYRDETRLEHMLSALRWIVRDAEKVTRDSLFIDDASTRVLMYDFMVLGEAANNMSDDYCRRHPELDWAGIAGLRHRLVHDYAGINYGTLWETITRDVPEILPKVEALVAALPPPPQPPQTLECLP